VAVGAAQDEIPAAFGGLAPSDRLHELGVAHGTDVKPARGLGSRLLEADDLDRPAAREDDSSYGMLVGMFVHEFRWCS
jgi:hypothetical protein